MVNLDTVTLVLLLGTLGLVMVSACSMFGGGSGGVTLPKGLGTLRVLIMALQLCWWRSPGL